MSKSISKSLILTQPLVDVAWLSENLLAPNLKILDASWYLPSDMRDPYTEFLNSHIPNSQFFDIDKISNPQTNLPHMLPSELDFSGSMQKLGLCINDAIVIYDGSGVFSAPRAWWMFRIFGHNNVAVLQGGMPAWLASNIIVESSLKIYPKGNFKAIFNPLLVRNLSEIEANIKTKKEQLVDARSEGRYYGRDPEPRPGLRSGHIPGSINLPYSLIINQKSGYILTPKEIRAKAKIIGLDLSQPVVTTCGSGISASLLALAFFIAGQQDTAVYDGSWTEWGSQKDSLIVNDEI